MSYLFMEVALNCRDPALILAVFAFHFGEQKYKIIWKKSSK